MSHAGYNWLFAQEEEDGDSEEEEDLEEIQSILYSTIHYEQMQEENSPGTQVTTGQVAYSLDLQEEVLSGEEKSEDVPQVNPPETATKSLKKPSQDGATTVQKHSPDGTTGSKEVNLSKTVSQKPKKTSPKKRKSQLEIIDLVSESDSSPARKSKKYVVIDSISDDSDVEITTQLKRRKKDPASTPSKANVITVDGVSSSSSSSDSDSSESCSDSGSEAVTPSKDVKINVHLNSNRPVLDCSELDMSDIGMDTTLEDIHNSLGGMYHVSNVRLSGFVQVLENP